MANKMKTYVLMLSREFPQTHPKAGKPTDFKTKKEDGVKKHTIRGNIELWEHRAEEINSGRAVLSVRQWSGKPYEPGSHQNEIFRLTELGTQRIILKGKDEPYKWPWVTIIRDDGSSHGEHIATIAHNDGLDVKDFYHWFNLDKCKEPFHGIILHFTALRY